MARSAGPFLFSHISGLSGVASLDSFIRFILRSVAGWMILSIAEPVLAGRLPFRKRKWQRELIFA